MLLISQLGVYLAGVLDTVLTKIKTIDPGFEEETLAFYQNEFGIFPCWVVRKKLTLPGDFPTYVVMTDSGLFLDIPAVELLTGWEENFPDRSEIDWGKYTNWREETVEECPDHYSESSWNPNEDWQPDDDYYAQLAEEYETALD